MLTLPTGLPDLDALLPGGGLARGAVTELVAPRGLGLSTALAMHVVALAQQAGGWAAAIDPACTLHGPGVAAHGVDLARLLVVRPPLEGAARAALRVAAAGPAVLVVDVGGVPGARLTDTLAPWVALVRRLATAGADTVTLLLTHRDASRALPLPVASRLELTQEQPGRLLLRRLGHYRGLPSEWVGCALPGWRAPVVVVARAVLGCGKLFSFLWSTPLRAVRTARILPSCPPPNASTTTSPFALPASSCATGICRA